MTRSTGQRLFLLPHISIVAIHHIDILTSPGGPASNTFKQNQAIHALMAFLLDEIVVPASGSCAAPTGRAWELVSHFQRLVDKKWTKYHNTR